ncbi:hypothetical protein D9757_005356 [Collybiopsis confluens]|uniref:Cas1p 10 TM acyl transferase domain-containing protein n=1 Tax=Collybiopsis confluens TaxID=2823264 RepID=A0A8H5M9C1_9AGAR|nr:hypothetical protein D9757_005356 [Collybiopsis confluens]
MSAKGRYALSPSVSQVTGVATVVLALCLGIGRWVLLDWFDPLHCNSLITRGSWLDSSKTTWQPEGCMLYQYKPETAETCLAGREVVFIGDSVTRRLFFQFAHLLDPSLPTAPQNDGLKHADHRFRTTFGSQISFYWDPFLNSTRTYAIISEESDTQNQSAFERPAILALGGGLWNLRYMEEIVPSKLSVERAESMHSSDIDAMNSDLYHRLYPRAYTSTYLSVALPVVFNQMLDPSQTQDGIHFADSVVGVQANILLNLHCNDKLPKRFPMEATCCRSYPSPGLLQLLIILSLLGLGGYQLWLSRPKDQSLNGWISTVESSPLFVLGVAITLIFLADRTDLWSKEQKLLSPWTFGFLCLVGLTAGLSTAKYSEKDLGFLNREQTDEWKGWMQVVILIYHYLGASKISGIYNPIRVLVAAYLFMSGYGHTTFYLKKGDFGFLRVAQVMVRLNLLTVILAYTMNTDYLSYYFAPLVSLWFIVIYLTLAAGSRYNNRTTVVIGKILLSAVLLTLFFYESWPLEGLFEILSRVFGIHWSAREWAFRVKLDLWIVYIGMFAALAVIKIQELHLSDERWSVMLKVATAASGLVMLWFFAFELSQESKFTYNYWHPYISFLPVLAFAVLRNASPDLRSVNSQFFAFIGRCSLETFIIQYHLWLAADTKGVLLVLPGTRWRPINFIITSIMFVYISNQVAHATGTLVTTICGRKTSATTLPSTATLATESPSSERQKSNENPRRWVDRLAASPQAPSFSKFWHRPAETNYAVRLAVIGVVLWIFNLLWPKQ